MYGNSKLAPSNNTLKIRMPIVLILAILILVFLHKVFFSPSRAQTTFIS